MALVRRGLRACKSRRRGADQPAFPPVTRIGYLAEHTTERNQVAKPNYQFEKRQRELEKKKKKAEKERKKAFAADPSLQAEEDAQATADDQAAQAVVVPEPK